MEARRCLWPGDLVDAISDYDGIADDVSRTSPAFAGGLEYIGDNLAGNVMAIDAQTAALRWITLAHPDPAAISTGSPVVADGLVYVGFSSRESSYDKDQGVECYRFRSALVARCAVRRRALANVRPA